MCMPRRERSTSGSTALLGRRRRQTSPLLRAPARHAADRGGGGPRPDRSGGAAEPLRVRHLARRARRSRRRGPVVLVCEDIHWADPASVDVCSSSCRSSRPLPVLVLFVGRAETDAPGWRLVQPQLACFGDALTEIRLQPLNDGDSRELVVQPARDRVAARGGSPANPDPLGGQSVLRRRGHPHAHRPRRDRAPQATAGWPTRRSTAVEIPDTLHGLLLARIDQLPDARQAQPARRLGHRPPVPGARAGASRSRRAPTRQARDRMTDLQLDTLEARGLIRLAAAPARARVPVPPRPAPGHRLRVAAQAGAPLAAQGRGRGARGALSGASRRSWRRSWRCTSSRPATPRRRSNTWCEAAKFADRSQCASPRAYDLYSRASALLPPSDPGSTTTRLRRRRIEIELGRARAGFTFLLRRANSRPSSSRWLPKRRAGRSAPRGGRPSGDRAAASVPAAAAPTTSPALRDQLERVTRDRRRAERSASSPRCRSQSSVSYEVFTGDMTGGRGACSRRRPAARAEARLRRLVLRARGARRWAMPGWASSTRPRRQPSEARHSAEQGDVIARIDALIGESTVHSMRGDLEAAVPLAHAVHQHGRGGWRVGVRRGQQLRAWRRLHAPGPVRRRRRSRVRSRHRGRAGASSSASSDRHCAHIMRSNGASMGEFGHEH